MAWSAALFHRNRKLIATVSDVRITDALAGIASAPGIVSPTGDNLVVGGTGMYPLDCHQYSRQQVEHYCLSPQRLRLADGLRTEERVMQLATSIAAQIEEIGDTYFQGSANTKSDVAQRAPDLSGALVSFGLGLGAHLPLLVEKLNFTNLVVIEPNIDFLIASLGTVDYAPVVEKLKTHQGQIHFVLDADPDQAASALIVVLRGRPFPLLEGSYYFLHYKTPFLEQLHKRITEFGPNLLSYNGWIEDDIVHLVNHAANTLSANTGSVRVLDPNFPTKPQLEPGPAVISGSGPSLQEKADLLRDTRKGFTLFSAGTSIGAVLKNGLRPDYHVELENVSAVGDLLRKTQDVYGLQGISLIASTTADPSVQSLFDDVTFFVREGDGVMNLAAGAVGQLSLVGPSGVNAAIRVAQFLGHSPIYIVGADFGSKDPANGYSSGVMYESIGEVNLDRQRRGDTIIGAAGAISGGMTIPVAGSTGGSVYSNPLLIYMRQRLEEQIRHLGLNLNNLGDGSKIEGAPFFESDRFLHECTTWTERRGSMRDKESRQTIGTTLLQAELPGLPELHGVAEEVDAYVDQFHSALDTIFSNAEKQDGFSSVDVLRAIEPFLPSSSGGVASENPKAVAVTSAFEGSMLRVFHVIRYIETRLPVSAQRRFVVEAVRAWLEYRPIWPVITADRIRSRLEHIETGAKGGSSVEPANPIQEVLSGRKTSLPDDKLLAALQYIGEIAPSVFPRVLVAALARFDRYSASTETLKVLYRRFFEGRESIISMGAGVDTILNMLCASYPFGFADRQLALFLRKLVQDGPALSVHQKMCVAFLYARMGQVQECRETSVSLMESAVSDEEKQTAGNYLLIAGELEMALKAFPPRMGEAAKQSAQLDMKGIALSLEGDVSDGVAYYSGVLENKPPNPDDFAVPLKWLIERYNVQAEEPAVLDHSRLAGYSELCEIAAKNTLASVRLSGGDHD